MSLGTLYRLQWPILYRYPLYKHAHLWGVSLHVMLKGYNLFVLRMSDAQHDASVAIESDHHYAK